MRRTTVDIGAQKMRQLRLAIERALASLGNRVSVRLIAEALSVSPEKVMSVIGVENLPKLLVRNGVEKIITELQRDGFLLEQKNLTTDLHDTTPNNLGMTGIQQAQIVAGFNVSNPMVAGILENSRFTLIQGITGRVEQEIREVVTTAFEMGGNPLVQARSIKDKIGLTPKQYRAVDNFRAQLEQRLQRPVIGGTKRSMQAIQNRLLTDRDIALARRHLVTGELSRKQINELVRRYQARLIELRAEVIARTESIRAASQGQQATWFQAQTEGVLDDRARRFWVYVHDDRTRKKHKAISRANPNGVRLDEDFKTPMGPIHSNPAGPSCRCHVKLDPNGGEKPQKEPSAIVTEEPVPRRKLPRKRKSTPPVSTTTAPRVKQKRPNEVETEDMIGPGIPTKQEQFIVDQINENIISGTTSKHLQYKSLALNALDDIPVQYRGLADKELKILMQGAPNDAMTRTEAKLMRSRGWFGMAARGGKRIWIKTTSSIFKDITVKKFPENLKAIGAHCLKAQFGMNMDTPLTQGTYHVDGYHGIMGAVFSSDLEFQQLFKEEFKNLSVQEQNTAAYFNTNVLRSWAETFNLLTAREEIQDFAFMLPVKTARTKFPKTLARAKQLLDRAVMVERSKRVHATASLKEDL